MFLNNPNIPSEIYEPLLDVEIMTMRMEQIMTQEATLTVSDHEKFFKMISDFREYIFPPDKEFYMIYLEMLLEVFLLRGAIEHKKATEVIKSLTFNLEAY